MHQLTNSGHWSWVPMRDEKKALLRQGLQALLPMPLPTYPHIRLCCAFWHSYLTHISCHLPCATYFGTPRLSRASHLTSATAITPAYRAPLRRCHVLTALRACYTPATTLPLHTCRTPFRRCARSTLPLHSHHHLRHHFAHLPGHAAADYPSAMPFMQNAPFETRSAVDSTVVEYCGKTALHAIRGRSGDAGHSPTSISLLYTQLCAAPSAATLSCATFLTAFAFTILPVRCSPYLFAV